MYKKCKKTHFKNLQEEKDGKILILQKKALAQSLKELGSTKILDKNHSG